MKHEAIISLLKEHAVITEGGAVGHLAHLYDNLGLTFGEIKEVIRTASEGKLEKVSEKLDGMNLVFTYDVSGGELLVARTGSDIKKGGMDAAALASKFFGRGNVEKAFNDAFTVLNQALGSLPDKVKEKVFGPNGNKWYSMEIIYAPDPNTINYDSSNIVFHGWPIFQVTESGEVEQSDDDSGIDLLSSKIEQMQKAVKMSDWRVRGPSLLSMKKLSDGSIARNAISKIDAAMAHAGVTDDNTVYDYLRVLMTEEVADLGLPQKAAEAAVERAITAPGAPGVPEIKKLVPKEQQKVMADFIRASEPLMKKMIQPIESAIHEFAIGVLNGLNSTLIARSDEEVARLQAQVSKAIKAIESSGNQAAMEILKKEMERLGKVENIGAAMEGIVFFYKGQAYKFTGAFAPAHQILSLFKYGRKGIPKMDMGEALLKHALRNLLKEGGHAFSDVKPISLEDLRSTWPDIKSDLEAMGCTNIEFVGSTGKKPIMGDVDIAAEFAGERDELFEMVEDLLGKGSAQKVGPNIVSVRYPVTGKDEFVQVDLMLGKTSYLKWSRYGTSPSKGHVDYSPAKGVVRNILLNTVNRFAASLTFPGQQTDLDRTRYSVDFDKGLYKVVQTKRNKTPGQAPLKGWKTVEKEFISDDPNKIAEVMFGKGSTVDQLKKTEDVISAIKSSKFLKPVAKDILSTFVDELRDFSEKNPSALGDDPKSVIDYVESISRG